MISFTLVDDDGEPLRKVQFHGVIKRVAPKEGIFIKRADGKGLFTLPPDSEAIAQARPGLYRLKPNGEEVQDPDFTAIWRVTITDPSTIDDVLLHGYRPEN